MKTMKMRSNQDDLALVFVVVVVVDVFVVFVVVLVVVVARKWPNFGCSTLNYSIQCASR